MITKIIIFLKSFFKKNQSELGRTGKLRAKIVPRADHTLSREHIPDNAKKVLYRLKKTGYASYLVGGCVRDLLLDGQPKDFDVATDAHPEDIKKVFRNCRLIGRRFRLAHIYFGREIIEVATFRALSSDTLDVKKNSSGMLVRDNVFGSIVEDVQRRDFTINALYYNIEDFSIVDYVGGMQDLKNKIIKIIGYPVKRYEEDPVRMLRVVRFACKLGFEIDPETENPIRRMASLLAQVAPARLYEEYLKMFFHGFSHLAFHQLQKYNLLQSFFPNIKICLLDQGSSSFIKNALKSTDQRYAVKGKLSPAFLLAVFLWQEFLIAKEEIEHENINDTSLDKNDLTQQAAYRALTKHKKVMSMPRHVVQMVKDIWLLQEKMLKTNPKSVFRVMKHEKFRAAYDFFLVRAQSFEDDSIKELSKWWHDFMHASAESKKKILQTKINVT